MTDNQCYRCGETVADDNVDNWTGSYHGEQLLVCDDCDLALTPEADAKTIEWIDEWLSRSDKIPANINASSHAQ